MPPFILEMPDRSPTKDRPNLRIMYTPNIYNPRVKITDWERERECLPRDNDPYVPHKINLHLANYKRLGFEPDEPYVTTTRMMLEQIKDKADYVIPNTNKYLVNYYAFHETKSCYNHETSNSVCTDFPNDYVTTMQKDYAPPYPAIMKGVTLPKKPFERYRKVKWPDPSNVDTKFWDDRLLEIICYSQRRKEVTPGVLKRINEL